MAKLSVSLPDELAEDLRAVAPENVSAFVSVAVRHELDRRRLFAFLDQLTDELGPPDEDEVAAFNAMFSQAAALASAGSSGKRGSGAARGRPGS